jgi:hypothetical protein
MWIMNPQNRLSLLRFRDLSRGRRPASQRVGFMPQRKEIDGCRLRCDGGRWRNGLSYIWRISDLLFCKHRLRWMGVA